MAEYTQTYWNRLIDKYREGTISDKDRYLLEKQALDDPFLFDALEGYSLYEKGNKENNKGATLTRFFTLPRIAVAASIVILVAVMFNMNLNEHSHASSDDTFAMVLEPEEEEALTLEDSEEEMDTEIATTSNSVEPNKQSSIARKEPSKSESPAKNKPEQKRKKAKKVEVEQKMPLTTKTTKAENEREEEVVISGRGIHKDKALIIDGATVLHDIPSTASEPIDQEVNEVIAVSNSRSQEDDIGKLELQKLPEGKELKLGEIGNQIVKGNTGVSIYYEAVPIIGKKIFDEFAKERIEERGLRQEKPQKVTIEFTIDKNGNLTDFHHIFTGCSECGPFAISLLQKSGEWKTVPPGLSGKSRYTFTF